MSVPPWNGVLLIWILSGFVVFDTLDLARLRLLRAVGSLSRLSMRFLCVLFFVFVTHVKDSSLKIICLSFLIVFLSSIHCGLVLEFDRREWAPRGAWYKVYAKAFACSLLSLSDSNDGSKFFIFCSAMLSDSELYVTFIWWIGFAVI